MRFGPFGPPQAQPGGPDVDSAAGFNDHIEYLIEAEALGYQGSFIVEQHSTGFGQVSAALNLRLRIDHNWGTGHERTDERGKHNYSHGIAAICRERRVHRQ